MNAQELELDYFKIYQVVEQEAGYQVALQGQFDPEYVDATLLYLQFFANVAEKTLPNGISEPIFDKTAHLACYSLYQPKPEPLRRVVVENQFGPQKITIGKPCALLAPALKSEVHSEFPERLDHYKLYWVLESEPVRQVEPLTFRDQFGEQRTKIAEPIAFGVPTHKVHRRQVSHIRNDKAHLMIYRIAPQLSLQAKVARDQFGMRYLHFLYSLALAAPSIKLEWAEERR